MSMAAKKHFNHEIHKIPSPEKQIKFHGTHRKFLFHIYRKGIVDLKVFLH